ncbi:hypothetical protein P7C70_g3200, partial [Phenoliferia sp. Uapishka_3]
MPAYVLDFSTASSWSMKEKEETAHYEEAYDSTYDSTPAAQSPVPRSQSLKNKIHRNPKQTAAVVAFIVVVPTLLGLLSHALQRQTSRTTSLVAGSTSLGASLSSILSSVASRTIPHVASSAISPPTSTLRFSLSSSYSAAHTQALQSFKLSTWSASRTASSLAAVASTIVPPSAKRSSCFPLGSATLPTSGKPAYTREDWWCESSLMYGFMGWSYPLESSDCSDSTNGFDAINADLKLMKARGASIVRIYAPECRQVSVWENLVKACLENNLALILQVWWGFDDDQTLWKTGQSNLYSLFTTSKYAAIAPYVVHSASFGSEPIGDTVDGGTTQFIADLAKFRKKMNGFGIPVGISEDWDRNTGEKMMNSTSGVGLGWVGELVKANTDQTHAHIMPYYHPTTVPSVRDAEPYILNYMKWLRQYVNQPTFVTEVRISPSAIRTRSLAHPRSLRSQCGRRQVLEEVILVVEMKTSLQKGEACYSSISCTKADCLLQYQVGYFFHTFQDNFEPGFGLLDDSGVAKIAGFYPKSC